ncbi:nitroreductase family protein [Peribacillus huizhouensis]|nr:nitroreductase family protein [Peribacillus huizhouensis]
MFSRSDIQSFLPNVIPEDMVNNILVAAYHVSSFGFMQNWNFILIF